MRSRVGEVELEYEIAGSGPDLVLLHGLGGNLESERITAEALASRFRVLWYSCRGCGRSSPLTEPARYRYANFAADLDHLLDATGFSRPLLVGGSHGANTILRHEADFPGRARKLLLIAPGANALSRPRFLPMLALIRVPVWVARRRGPDTLVRLVTGAHPSSPKANARMVAAARTHEPRSLAVALRHTPDQPAVDPAALRRFRVPAHVVAWAKDPFIHPLPVARRVAALIPGATFEEIERVIDLGPEEIAARMLEVVLQWDPQP